MTEVQEARCLVTGNPVGTDTWQVGKPCQCFNCQAMLAARPTDEPKGGLLSKRPVAFRVKNGEGWSLYHSEELAYAVAEETDGVMQGLYVRDGTPNVFSDEPKGDVRKALESAAQYLRQRAKDIRCAASGSDDNDPGWMAANTLDDAARRIIADEFFMRWKAALTEDGCLCQGCGARYRVDILVPDDVWARISPKSKGGGLLCGRCIVQRIEDFGEFGAYHLTGDVRKALDLLETIIVRCEECWLHGITKLAREAKAALSTPGQAREGGE